MNGKQRQDKIMEILEQQGYVTAKYLAETLNYSSATVNRDLNALQSRRLITRSYGGVELTRSAYTPVLFRTHKMRAEKKHIGKKAAEFVKDGDTIFIDASTTAQCMEQYIINRKDLTVITNNMALAVNLSKYDVKVICLGGTVVEAPCMLNGQETVENASGYRVDKMFFSTGAITEDGLISSGIYDALFKAVAQNAAEVFYLVDHKKVNQPFNTIFCHFGDVDYIVSDFVFSEKAKKKYPNTHFVLADGGVNTKNA